MKNGCFIEKNVEINEFIFKKLFDFMSLNVSSNRFFRSHDYRLFSFIGFCHSTHESNGASLSSPATFTVKEMAC
jgi:hypothetical protein